MPIFHFATILSRELSTALEQRSHYFHLFDRPYWFRQSILISLNLFLTMLIDVEFERFDISLINTLLYILSNLRTNLVNTNVLHRSSYIPAPCIKNYPQSIQFDNQNVYIFIFCLIEGELL